MMRTGVRIQLVAFAMIAVVSVVYAAFRFGGLDRVFSPPFTVHVHFASAAGIEPKDEVDEVGVDVGSVSALHPDGNGVIVDISLHHGIRIPQDLHAAIADKSALGEQYVLLTPLNPSAPPLKAGSVIPMTETSTPLALQDLIGNLDSLAKSVPKKDLRTDLSQLSTAFADSGPDLQRLLDQGDALTKTALENLDDTISLINSSTTVLRTQVAETDATRQLSQQLAGFTHEVRTLDPEIAQTFVNGVNAGAQITGLLKDNQQVLPGLLNSVLTTTDVTRARIPQLRKTLTLYPWVIQVGASAIRYCDNYNVKTGKPVKSTCHYDPKTGKRIYTGHFAFQAPEGPGDPPYNPCTKGYGGTTHYLPNGSPASGSGPKETPNTAPNGDAQCTASPTDPNAPNVRGSQNAQRPPGDNSVFPRRSRSHSARRAGGRGAESRLSLGASLSTIGHDLFVIAGLAGPNPPSGPEGLVWLLLGEPTSSQG
jgi:phospholipid/cholesterol/gamma-HCH transport system substrate-binding protein